MKFSESDKDKWLEACRKFWAKLIKRGEFPENMGSGIKPITYKPRPKFC